MNPQNDLALQGFDELFSSETHPFGLFQPLFLSQGCSSAFHFVSQEAPAPLPISPLLRLGWVKPGVMEKGSREKSEDSPVGAVALRDMKRRSFLKVI